MSSVLNDRIMNGAAPAGSDGLSLPAVIERIRAARSIDDAVNALGTDLCTLFNADRVSIYLVADGGAKIVSKLKTGLSSFREIRLPVSDQSVAGFVAANKRILNIRNVYDERELRSLSPTLRFLREVDKRTGYRSKQMLVAPIVDADTSRELIGVVQLINSRNDQPFPVALQDTLAHVCDALAAAFRKRQDGVSPLHGKYERLVADAVISAGELELAMRSARAKGADIETILMQDFQLTSQILGEALGAHFGVPYEPFKNDRVKPVDLMKHISREFVVGSRWVPIDDTDEGIVVLTTDPERIRGSRVVNNVYPKRRIAYRVCTHREFDATVEQLFGATAMQDTGSIGDLVGTLEEATGDDETGATDDVASAANDNELVRLVNKIIIDAYQQGASDIHIEPYPGKQKIEVRFRRDGVLHPYISVPSTYRRSLVARIKIMCDLDISERRKPQDGKIKFRKFGPLDIELRVATVPSQGGLEDVVMRILASGEPMPIDKLALSDLNLKRLKDTVAKPYGLFFVCGPTGSGKTTTLHSILRHLNTSDTKIWTAEDPVEITQRGLRQVQMNPKAGLTFATAMRAFLRADPDIIMVGEMRDQETVSTGIEASLTGHLVFATLHTNSAPESIVRLLDMGMDPFNFADALLGVLAQRLARRLCTKCRKPHVATDDEIQLLMDEYALELKHTEAWRQDPQRARQQLLQDWTKSFADSKGKFTLYEASGCDACGNVGYRGRVGLHELLLGTDPVKKLIQEHARVADLFVTAIGEGMRTLKQDGIEKVLSGVTDMQQVRAVCIK
ncbi:MAG TPA: ATPase, T2SS/T4P/T4SS family [Burkholderiales bacterium]|nr:ATPase, T2SS/T4P/T4SS family [Burkholderiales bacterium]